MSDSDRGSAPGTPLLEAGNDNGLPLEDRDTPPAPAANPNLDMDDPDNAIAGSDDDSDLSEVDEAEFADFDPTAVALEDRPVVDIDEEAVKTIKAGKKKRADGEAKKPKEGRREKKKKPRKDDRDTDDVDPDGVVMEGKRSRKSKPVDGDPREKPKERKKSPEPENEADLSDGERRRRALDRQIDAAIRGPNKRRRAKKDEEDLENAYDEEIAALKVRMEKACVADNSAREKGEPAVNKLKMLPEVVAILNRTELQSMILDPETSFLQSVKYYLEPLNDGSLPAYNIQRDIFAIMLRLPIEREALQSSGIGKLVLYYTKSKKTEPAVKRTAEKLLGEWSRPILKRSDDYKKRKVASKEFDFQAAQLAIRQAASGQPSQVPASQRPTLSRSELERQKLLAPTQIFNRARIINTNTSYSVAPKSTFDPSRGLDPNARPIGASGMEAFRKMTANRMGPKKK